MFENSLRKNGAGFLLIFDGVTPDYLWQLRKLNHTHCVRRSSNSGEKSVLTKLLLAAKLQNTSPLI